MPDNIERAWIETAGGRRFHILDPRQDEIVITDIAHALSMLCRFTGHVREFYSVAEHSVHASFLVPPEDALWALLHDASEAYLGDMNRPLKHYTTAGPAYTAIEDKIMAAICRKFDLSISQPESVHKADTAMLYAEKAQLMSSMPWDTKRSEDSTQATIRVKCWKPKQARVNFLYRFYQLTEAQ